MAIENSVSKGFLSTFIDSIKVFNCCLSGVRNVLELYTNLPVCCMNTVLLIASCHVILIG